jgi:hypothetical protein
MPRSYVDASGFASHICAKAAGRGVRELRANLR